MGRNIFSHSACDGRFERVGIMHWECSPFALKRAKTAEVREKQMTVFVIGGTGFIGYRR